MRFLHTLAIAAALGIAVIGGSWCVPAPAGSPASSTGDWPSILHQRLDHEGVAGTLVLAGGGDSNAAAQAAFVAAVPAGTTVVIIPLFATDSNTTVKDSADWLRAAGLHPIVTAPDANAPDVTALGADTAGGAAALVEVLRSAGGAWICGDPPSQLAQAYAGSAVEVELQALLRRGGVIGGDAAAALCGVRFASKSQIDQEDVQSQLSTGLDLVPGAIIDQHFSQQDRSDRLRLAVAEHPERYGLGIQAATAVVVQGRTLRVVGERSATILLAKSSRHAAVEQPIPSGAMLDLTQLQRAARWRAADVDPGQPRFGAPHVASGSLVIVGGGGMSQSIVDRFLSLAGGSAARIVVLPTAVPRREAFRARVPRFLARAEVASVTMLPHSRTAEIADAAFETALREATGIWFDGGRQWNFVDAYENTRAIELFHAVLRRGGVIGGSSAGATIQGEYLVRGHPLGNTVMMAEGYERGFAFLPGVAIDQHFSQRQRHLDLIPVIQRHPRLLGIGIDEATALVVSGSRAEVIGEHAVHFLRLPNPAETPAEDSADQNGAHHDPPQEPTESAYLSVATGEAIDLQTLQRLPAPQAALHQAAAQPAQP